MRFFKEPSHAAFGKAVGLRPAGRTWPIDVSDSLGAQALPGQPCRRSRGWRTSLQRIRPGSGQRCCAADTRRADE
nr:hypothetical protein [Pseudomonas sp. Lz4W]